jgi:hypothetical protein
LRAWKLAAAVNIGWIGLDAISSRIRDRIRDSRIREDF